MARERDFFDAATQDLDIGAMPPREHAPFDSRFEDAILDLCGPLQDKTVLDLGCGVGDLTFRLADRGADVTALDASPASIDVAQQRAERFRPGAQIRFVTAPVEATGLAGEAFDLVVGKWVLHHLDLPRALPEIKRVLAPGGKGIFIETSGLNPLLRFARKHLAGRGGIAQYGTPDERPLTRADVELLHREFRACTIDHPNVVLFHLLDRHVLKWRWPGLSRALNRVDGAVERRQGAMTRWSYYLRVHVQR